MSADDFFIYPAIVRRKYPHAYSGTPEDEVVLQHTPNEAVCFSLNGGDYSALFTGSLDGTPKSETISVQTVGRGYELFDSISSIALSDWSGIPEINIDAIRLDGTPFLVLDILTQCMGNYKESSEVPVITEGGEIGNVRGTWKCYLPEIDVQQYDMIEMDTMNFTVIRKPKEFYSLITEDFSHIECQVILEGAENV